jgi:superfamily II DNA or RNA helicase
VLAPVRQSLAVSPPSLVYQLSSAEGGLPTVSWLGTTPVAADELVARVPGRKHDARERAAAFLKQFLAGGPRSAEDIRQAAQKGRWQSRGRGGTLAIRPQPPSSGRCPPGDAMPSAALPQPGQIVRARQRQYLVEEVVAPPQPGHSPVVRLACVDDDAQGQPLAVLWDREVDAEVLTDAAWADLAARDFDPPARFSAYLHTLRWNCVTATDPRLFQSPFRAGIRLDAYQLEPLRKALVLPRVNLFIADDVGLGKTIEAGLIARELLLRKKVHYLVVACPPSVLPQWQDELETRFGLTFEVLDKDFVSRVRRERGYGVNPWTTHTRFLISHRLLIDETYAGPLRDWLGELCPGSLLILDEAHHAAPASGQRYAIDSKITRAVRDLAPRFEHRLFLSATPHNGHSNSFSALLEILDPQRFCRGVPVRSKKLLTDVMVRRLKEDIREAHGGFPHRVVRQVDLDGLPADAAELRLAALLDSYRQLREQRLEGTARRVRALSGLLLSGLQQRLFSSVEAFARTLRVHRKTAEAEWQRAATAPPPGPSGRLPFDRLGSGVGSDDDRAALPEEELQQEEEAQFEAATRFTAAPGSAAPAGLIERERQLLREMAEVADRARNLPDARVRQLVHWMRQRMCPGLPSLDDPPPASPPAAWNNLRVLIFTEYEATVQYLRRQLEPLLEATERGTLRLEVYNGPTSLQRREEIKRAFNADPAEHPLRILLCTDAAREGLNLQTHCWNLFHFDVPWNPSRMEQRNGRIDRKLQPSAEVTCHYFVYRQRPEDRILQKLVEKTRTIKRELGSLSQVIEGRLADLLAGGIRRGEVERLAGAIESADLDAADKRTVVEELEEARERQDQLKEQVETLRTQLNRSREWIGLDEEHFRSAISCALQLTGAEPLGPVPARPADGGPVRYRFPAVDQRAGADPTWADTLDTLRAPRPRDQRPAEWRSASPLRPVVFEDPGTMDEQVVHLHLEHRVVQRLLGRFLAQGFVHHDLSRACLASTRDAIPRVILIGRLSLYGAGAARLHEELIFVTARWFDLEMLDRPLKPYRRDAEEKTLDLLEQALLPQAQRTVPPEVQARLLRCAPHDVRDLVGHLEQRGAEIAEEAAGKLRERGEREAKDMRAILEEQRRRIAATAEKSRGQEDLFTSEEERRQLEANRRHWAGRLQSIERELESEPQRVREVYAVRARRVEPVGLVYLWPVTG